MGKPMFYPVPIRVNGKHVGYQIYFEDAPFLKQIDKEFRLKRHEAYAIARLLNTEERCRKWAEKFSDPY